MTHLPTEISIAECIRFESWLENHTLTWSSAMIKLLPVCMFSHAKYFDQQTYSLFWYRYGPNITCLCIFDHVITLIFDIWTLTFRIMKQSPYRSLIKITPGRFEWSYGSKTAVVCPWPQTPKFWKCFGNTYCPKMPFWLIKINVWYIVGYILTKIWLNVLEFWKIFSCGLLSIFDRLNFLCINWSNGPNSTALPLFGPVVTWA